MVPHAGKDSDVWRGTVALGRALEALAEVAGSRVLNRVALVMDYPSWWASELDSHPTQALRYNEEMLRWYTALWDLGIGVDLVPTGTDLTGYELVIAPTLYSVSGQEAERVAEAARAGAQVVITFFSGIVDENEHIYLGGYPGAFRELLGVRTEEFYALQEGEVLHLDDGTAADLWSEKTHLEGAETVRTWADGALHGRPAGDPERRGGRGRCGLVCGRSPVGRGARDAGGRDRRRRRGGVVGPGPAPGRRGGAPLRRGRHHLPVRAEPFSIGTRWCRSAGTTCCAAPTPTERTPCPPAPSR